MEAITQWRCRLVGVRWPEGARQPEPAESAVRDAGQVKMYKAQAEASQRRAASADRGGVDYREFVDDAPHGGGGGGGNGGDSIGKKKQVRMQKQFGSGGNQGGFGGARGNKGGGSGARGKGGKR